MDIEDIIITDEFQEIVERVDTALFPTLNQHIKFFFGEDEHVIKYMRDMNKAELSRYPLIALVSRITVTRNDANGHYGKTTIPRIVIATLTDPNKSPEQRKEEIIKPVILPIVNELIEQIKKQKAFVIIGDRLKYSETIRYGTQTAIQGFAEYIDGMELENMELTLNKICKK